MTLREMDALIAEKMFGWYWFQAPQFDANGPLPEQGKVLCPPGMPCPGFEWPRTGVIHPHYFLNQKCYRYTTEPDASKHLRTKLGETWNWLSGCGGHDNKPYAFALYRRVKPQPENEDFIDEADTEELAVCLCALKSVGIEVGAVE